MSADASEEQRLIYDQHAERYAALVQVEDADGRLRAAVQALVGAGSDVLDVGAGTGRLTDWLLDAGGRVTALDQAPAMLEVARQRLGDRATVVVGDARKLPFERRFDLAIAGWAFGHFCHWFSEDALGQIAAAVGEMERVVRAGGDAVIIETYGTAVTEAGPPNPSLASYYDMLTARGFTRRVLETDYVFSSLDAAVEQCSFFFGEGKGKWVRQAGSPRVPEFTAMFTKKVEH